MLLPHGPQVHILAHTSPSTTLPDKDWNSWRFTLKGFQFIFNLILWDTSSPQSHLKLLCRTVSRVQMPSVRRYSSLSCQCFLAFVSFVSRQETWEERRRAVLPSPKESRPPVTRQDAARDQPPAPEARDVATVGKAR